MSIGNTRRQGRAASLAIFLLLLISPAVLFAQTREMPLTASIAYRLRSTG